MQRIIFCQNYLFHSSKEEFLHNIRQFLENWIFEGISTGADLTKMVKICIILICAKKIFFGKIICSTHQRKCFSTILSKFWKIEFLKEYRQARDLTKWWKFELSQFVLRKFFLAKLFVPLIKGSVSPQFYVIFGKLNFWRNIDRRGPYKNGEYLNYLKLCKENIFCQNYLFHSSKEVFLHNFTQFLENWIFEGISTGADLTKMVNIWTILNCAKKIFFCQNYLFHSSKEVFLHNFTQFLENWILKEYRQARTLQ